MNDTRVRIQPIVKKLTLKAHPERAFRHFTENIHLWWPLATHSVSEGNATTAVFEAREGGRLYEIEKDGRQREWGRVKVCDPPRRVVFSWVLEKPECETEVEVTFDPRSDGGSDMTLIHRNWENRPDGAEWRDQYDDGWAGVLAGFIRSVDA